MNDRHTQPGVEFSETCGIARCDRDVGVPRDERLDDAEPKPPTPADDEHTLPFERIHDASFLTHSWSGLPFKPPMSHHSRRAGRGERAELAFERLGGPVAPRLRDGR